MRQKIVFFSPSSLSANAWLNNKARYQSASFYTACLLEKIPNPNILQLNITHSQTENVYIYIIIIIISSGSTCFPPACGFSNCAFSHVVSNHEAPSACNVTKVNGPARRERATSGVGGRFVAACVSVSSWKSSSHSNICSDCGHAALTPTGKSF